MEFPTTESIQFWWHLGKWSSNIQASFHSNCRKFWIEIWRISQKIWRNTNRRNFKLKITCTSVMWHWCVWYVNSWPFLNWQALKYNCWAKFSWGWKKSITLLAKKLTKLIQFFWKKWHALYFNNLLQRSKWVIKKIMW